MNAPIPNITETLELLPLDTCRVSPLHVQTLRRKRFSPESLIELAADIKVTGVIQPIIVRPVAPDGTVKFEIVCGERRWLASDRAGRGHVPAIVRPLTDEEALKLQLSENLQREDMHPLEEGQGFQDLMAMSNIDAETVGGLFGKSRAYVYNRTKLLDLIPAARDALQSGELDASKALLIARLVGENQQQKALKTALEKNYHGNQCSYRELFDTLRAKHMLALTGVPWALDDASLFRFEKIAGRRGQEEAIALPACTVCPKFSGNDTELAAGLPENTHVCTDGECHAAKGRAIALRRRKEAEAEGHTILAGEEAKKIAPRRDKLVGYVDLDECCDFDPFPEPEPKLLKGEDEDSPAAQERFDAWETRQAAWTGRTYRELLKDQKIDITRIEDPKTKAVRELVRLKDAKALLAKQHEITLPSHVGAPEPAPRAPEPRVDYAEEQRKRQERETAELGWRQAVLMAIAGKCAGPLKRDDLVDIADELMDEHWTKQALKLVYDKTPEPGDLKEADLPKLIRLMLIAGCCVWAGQQPGPLLAAAKRWKVDVAKIKKDLTAKNKPAAAAPATKAAAKKKAAKK